MPDAARSSASWRRFEYRAAAAAAAAFTAACRRCAVERAVHGGHSGDGISAIMAAAKTVNDGISFSRRVEGRMKPRSAG